MPLMLSEHDMSFRAWLENLAVVCLMRGYELWTIVVAVFEMSLVVWCDG
jgi:uncharacterized membrane protein YpjA